MKYAPSVPARMAEEEKREKKQRRKAELGKEEEKDAPFTIKGSRGQKYFPPGSSHPQKTESASHLSICSFFVWTRKGGGEEKGRVIP